MIRYRALEDMEVTVINDVNPLEPYNLWIPEGTVLVLVAMPKKCRIAILRYGIFLVCVEKTRLEESFEETWGKELKIES